MILLKDKMPIFKNIIDLRAYVEEYANTTSTESYPTKNTKTSNINSFLLKEFSCFCAKDVFFKQYGEVIVQHLDSDLEFPSIYNGILDVFYAPYKTQLLLSALYTAEYLKLHNIYITVPDYLHLYLDLSASNLQKTGGFTSTDFNINKPEQPPDILYNRKTYDTPPYSPPTSEERKMYYDKFFGKRVSRYWDKLFYTTEKDIECRDTHAVPVFLCDLTAELLYNNIDTGLKNSNIDILEYLNILNAYPHLKNARDITECKNILLKKYKLETIFKPVSIIRILQALIKLEADFDYQESYHLLSRALECDFIFLYTLLPYLSYTPSRLMENDLTHEDLLSSFLHYRLKPEDYYTNADYLYHHDDMDSFF